MLLKKITLITLVAGAHASCYQNQNIPAIAEISKNNFTREVSESTMPVIMAVVSKHNKSSKLLEPLLVELTKELAGQCKVVIISFDKNSAFLKDMNIVHAPVLVLYNNGKKLGSIELSASPDEIKSLVQHILKLRILTSLNYYRIIIKLLGKIH